MREAGSFAGVKRTLLAAALLVTSVFSATGCGSDDGEAPVESRIKNTGEDSGDYSDVDIGDSTSRDQLDSDDFEDPVLEIDDLDIFKDDYIIDDYDSDDDYDDEYEDDINYKDLILYDDSYIADDELYVDKLERFRKKINLNNNKTKFVED